MYLTIFTNSIWSYQLWSPETVKIGKYIVFVCTVGPRVFTMVPRNKKNAIIYTVPPATWG